MYIQVHKIIQCTYTEIHTDGTDEIGSLSQEVINSYIVTISNHSIERQLQHMYTTCTLHVQN